MTVQEFLEIITSNVAIEDREIAEIEFVCGEQDFEIESMGGFSLSPDIVITLAEVKKPLIRPATFKAEHAQMVSATMKKIAKDREE